MERLEKFHISLRAIEQAFDEDTLADLIADYVAFGGYIADVYEVAKESKIVTKEDIDSAVKFLTENRLLEDLTKEYNCVADTSVDDGLVDLCSPKYSLIEDVEINDKLNIETMTVADLLESSAENMSDEQLDDEIDFFNRVARELGVSDYNKVLVTIDEENTNPDLVLTDGVSLDIPNREAIKYKSANMISEQLNSYTFLYFKYKKDLQKYFTLLDKIKNPEVFEEDFGYSYSTKDRNEQWNKRGYYTEDGDFVETVEKAKTLKEALESIDRRTGNKFDLVNDYLCANLSDQKKAQIREFLYKPNAAENIHKFLHKAEADPIKVIQKDLGNRKKQGEVSVNGTKELKRVQYWLDWNSIPYDQFEEMDGSTTVSWYLVEKESVKEGVEEAAEKLRKAYSDPSKKEVVEAILSLLAEHDPESAEKVLKELDR